MHAWSSNSRAGERRLSNICICWGANKMVRPPDSPWLLNSIYTTPWVRSSGWQTGESPRLANWGLILGFLIKGNLVLAVQLATQPPQIFSMKKKGFKILVPEKLMKIIQSPHQNVLCRAFFCAVLEVAIWHEYSFQLPPSQLSHVPASAQAQAPEPEDRQRGEERGEEGRG